jgi:signal transduction histidine kinase
VTAVEPDFDLHARKMTARHVRVMAYCVSAGALLFWPFDFLLYDAETRAVMAELRLGPLVVCITYVAVLRFIGEGHRAVKPLIALADVALLVGLARPLARLDPTLFMAGISLPLATIPLTVPPLERVFFTLLVAVAYATTYFSCVPEVDTAMLGDATGLLAFTSILSLAFGHVYYSTLRNMFHQRVALHESERALALSNRDLADRVAARTTELRRLASHLENAREEERRYLAREIHDETGQLLTALRIELDIALGVVSDPETRDSLERMTRIVEQTLDAMRALVAELRPRVLDDLGLGAAVEWLVQSFGERTHVAWSFRVEPPDLTAEATTSTAIYRVLQESLTNAVRHGHAAHVSVSLVHEADEIVLEVLDDGVGFDPDAASDGTGVIGMRERAQALAGRFSLARREEGGTRLLLTLPYLPAEES